MLYFSNPASGFRRLALYELIQGSDPTPADQACEMQVTRLDDENVTPGGTTVTAVALDEDSPASVCAAAGNILLPSGAATLEANEALQFGLNQRATFRWIAAPGSELIASAAEDTGWCLYCGGVTSGWNANMTMLWEE
jgi:hypothetical protein